MSENIQMNSHQISLLKSYNEEASRELGSQATSKQAFKDILEAAAEGTGLEKKVLRKFFTLAYNEKIRDAEEEGGVMGFLADQIGQ